MICLLRLSLRAVFAQIAIEQRQCHRYSAVALDLKLLNVIERFT
jgi:hypothetical protein